MSKKLSFSDIRTSSQFRNFVFYLFVTLCGFIAGTRIWFVCRLPSFSVDWLSPAENFGLFPAVIIISAVIFIIAFLLSFFAAGWIILPFAAYFTGTAAGAVICSFFGVSVTITSFSVPFTASACLISVLVCVCYVFSLAHSLSHQLSQSGCTGSAYKYFCGNLFLAALLIASFSICYEGILYLHSIFA